jgi:hypothetical protein
MAGAIQGQWSMDPSHNENEEFGRGQGSRPYMESRYGVKHGIPAQSKLFKDVASLAIGRMEQSTLAGEGKSVYRDYIQAIDNYPAPFFGQHQWIISRIH